MDIYSFSSTAYTEDKGVLDVLGYRGRRLMHLAGLGIPILPGYVLSNDSLLAELEEPGTYSSKIHQSIENMDKVVGKKYGDSENPLLIKYVLSPQLNMIDTFSSLHNVGLCKNTIDGFAKFVGEEFAYHEYRNMLRRVMILDLEIEPDSNRRKLLEKTGCLPSEMRLRQEDQGCSGRSGRCLSGRDFFRSLGTIELCSIALYEISER